MRRFVGSLRAASCRAPSLARAVLTSPGARAMPCYFTLAEICHITFKRTYSGACSSLVRRSLED